MSPIDEEMLIHEPSTSNWLRQQIEASKSRDPVDALTDAELLVEILDLWLRLVEKQHSQSHQTSFKGI